MINETGPAVMNNGIVDQTMNELRRTDLTRADMEALSESSAGLNPAAFAAILMQQLPLGEARMTVEAKTFWTEMAHELGPDWIAQFRLVGDFMDKVDEF